MSAADSRPARRSWRSTGFYIALFLGVTVLAVAGYWKLVPHNSVKVSGAAQSAPAVESAAPSVPAVPAAPVPPVLPAMGREDAEEEAPADEAPPPEESSAPSAAPPGVEEVWGAQDVWAAEDVWSEAAPEEPRLIVRPLEGETVAAFSPDALVYSETLGDWRTHSGVDIAAENGTPVLAACAGRVLFAGEDDLMGTTVVLDHGGGCETVYANLAPVPPVEAGQEVAAGQQIGAVGASALSEAAMVPHLHFAVRQDGENADPEKFLNGLDD